jgi:hypothetical protein
LGVYKYNVDKNETNFKFFETATGFKISKDRVENGIKFKEEIIYIKKEDDNNFLCMSGHNDFPISFED